MYIHMPCRLFKVSKGAKIRNRYNQEPQLTQDTNGKVTNSQLDTTNESQEVSPFPAGDHKAHINRRAQRHSKHKTEQKHKRSTRIGASCLFQCIITEMVNKEKALNLQITTASWCRICMTVYFSWSPSGLNIRFPTFFCT